MKLKEVLKPIAIKIISTLIIFFIFLYFGLSNIELAKCSSLGCPELNTPLYKNIILWITLWPAVLTLLLIGNLTNMNLIIPFLFELIYAYLIFCLFSFLISKIKKQTY